VELYLKGWEVGFKKVGLSKLMRDGGLSMADAMRVTGEILEGRGVYVFLPNFHDPIELMHGARALGLTEVHVVDRKPDDDPRIRVAHSPSRIVGRIVRGRVEVDAE